ncbi:MAG: DEAD/DEAH box helicase [Phycisphaerales bacterium]
MTPVSAPVSNSNAPASTQSNAKTDTQVTFASLKLAPPILDALVADGYQFPTPIQAQAIPPALELKDVLGIAQTGTGKTAAFALPILNRLLGEIPRGAKLPVGRRPKALVLAPTRELAAQIAESFSSYGRHTPIRLAVIFGGVGQGPQVRAIQQGIDVLVATPGRLIDLLDQRLVNLSEIEFFVLDEADRMLDMGFIEPIRRISAMLPRDRQTMLFSATMPKEIRHLANSLLDEPVTVTVTPVSSAVDRIDQKLYFVLKAQKTQLLIHLFDTIDMDRTVVFTKTKHGADRLVRKLKAAGIHADAIHGNKAQNQRVRALDGFRSGRVPVLVATDVAARGLDVDDITHVINYDLPMEPEAYVHRIGRTARAGKSGHAIAFCDVDEKGLLKQIERLTKFEIPRERVPDSVPKTDEAAAKSGLAPKPLLDERDEDEDRGHGRGQDRGQGRGQNGGQHGGQNRGQHRGQGGGQGRDGGSRARPMIETHLVSIAAPAVKPRMNAAGRPMPAMKAPSMPAQRPHGPRVDRRMDDDAPQGERAPRGGHSHPRSEEGRMQQSSSNHGSASGGPKNPGSNGVSPKNAGPKNPGPKNPGPKSAGPKFGAPKHGGPAKYGQNPFSGGKPTRGSNFKGGTGFKGPKP